MFHFMKKDKDKDKEKKDKKDKEKKDKKDKNKQKDRQPCTEEELNRLEEAKKGVFSRFSDRDKQRSSKFYQTGGDSGSGEGLTGQHESSDSSLSSAGKPSPPQENTGGIGLSKPLPPPRSNLKRTASADKPPPALKPKPRGILKSGSQGDEADGGHVENSTADDSIVLQQNTMLNEELSGRDEAPVPSSRSTKGHIHKKGPAVSKKPTLGATEEAAVPSPTFNRKLKLPDIVPPEMPHCRTVVIKRQTSGGFGFSLRKGFMAVPGESQGGDQKTSVIFAEPGNEPRNSISGLLPGDHLIEVNGHNVEVMPRDEIVDLIRDSTEEVTLLVQPIPELVELSVRPSSSGSAIHIGDEVVKGGTLKRSGSIRFKGPARSEDEILSDKAWLDTDKVWLVHKGGFSAAHVIRPDGAAPLPDGRAQVKLEQTEEVFEVDEDDMEKANPPQFDKAEDLSTLRFMNESSILHSLRQRYGSHLIHTYAGPSMVIINPMTQLAIYSDKVIQMFKGCKQEDIPPHIYATAQIVYREMLNTRRDQSVVMLGRSGSGKSTNAHHVLHYLTVAAGTVGNVLAVDKLNAVMILLEGFGNSRTILNTNASRFAHMTTLDFDHAGQIVSASIQMLMFEKTRVVRRPEGEPTFHVFYQMLAGLDSQLRKDLQLNLLNESNLFMTPLQRNEDRQRASQAWAKIQNAMETIGMSDSETRAILYVLAAIYHLGVAATTKGTNNKAQFLRPASAQRAATLLGISPEELSRMIFTASPVASGTLNRNTSYRSSGSPGDKSGAPDLTSAQESLEGFVVGLYHDVFSAILSLINRSLASNYRSVSSIIVVDAPGFQNPSSCSRNTGASFDDLCHNYTHERLQLLFHDLTFTSQQDRYAQENIECDFEFVTTSTAAMVNLIDKSTPQSLVRGVSSDSKDIEKKGLLWLLDEEAIFPGATDDSFMERLFTHHGEHPVRKTSLLRKASLGNQFVLNHCQGTSPVQYNAAGWLRICREHPATKISITVLQDSSRTEISQLFTSVRGPVVNTVSGSVVGMDGSASLRRVSSMRRTYTSGAAGLKRKSICLQIKFQVDSVIETLRKTRCHFVHCMLPQHNSGLCELMVDRNANTNVKDDDLLLSVPLLRSQQRGAEILDAIRIFRQGFPEVMVFKEFRARFEVLLPAGVKLSESADERQAIIQLLEHLDVDKLSYRVGLSQVFFRAGALARLELTRDEKISDTVIGFQSHCRGYVARKQLKHLRVQHLAVRCIQKNSRLFMFIRDWPWWKLYVKVKPLLNVQRTEDELKNKELELEQMRMKLEKLEKERGELKTSCNRLETKLSDVTADLAEENTTSTQAAEILEVETAERMRLEKDLKEIQSKYGTIKRHNEKLQEEVMQVRLWQVSSVDGELEDDDVDGGDSIYRDRYERVRRELDYTKKQLNQQHQEALEQEQGNKKVLERRLHESQEDAEDQRRQLLAAKRKSQRLTSEFQDTKRHLEEQMTRNNELEKKQRKFDTELNKVHEGAQDVKIVRERLQREKDELLSEKMGLEQTIKKMQMDGELENEKSRRLERELSDLTHTGPKDDHEVMALKRAKMEFENKVKDQEEELDDQAGTIQQLEQGKLRLEMLLENGRQQHLKELDDKESEMQELRYSTQKRVKTLEKQIEEDYSERQQLMREKREVESRLGDLTNRTPQRDRDHEKKIRRDLHRTRALLRDAELVIHKQKGAEGTRATIKQLRNQLEDAEFNAATSIKAKKAMEAEIQDLQQQLEDIARGKQESEDRNMGLLREKSDIESKLDENDEDMADVMKKYKAVVQQQSVDHITLSDHLRQVEELTSERNRLKEQVTELSSRVQIMEENTVDKLSLTRLEAKIKDLETKLEYESTAKHRYQSQVTKLKEANEKMMQDKENLSASKLQSDEVMKRVQKQLRDLREEFSSVQKREMEAAQRKQELESRVEELHVDYEQSQSDLKLAFRRITDLQAALEDDINSDDSILIDSDDDDLLSDSEEEESGDLAAFIKKNTAPRTRSLASSTSSRSRISSSLDQSLDGPRLKLDSQTSMSTEA